MLVALTDSVHIVKHRVGTKIKTNYSVTFTIFSFESCFVKSKALRRNVSYIGKIIMCF